MNKLLFILVFSLMACHKKLEIKPFSDESFKKIEITEKAKEIYIPKQIWNEIELQGLEGENYVRVKKKQESKFQSNDWSLDNTGSLVFTKLIVQLWEKNKNILIEPNLEFHFPLGGGEIDLSQFLTGKKGTFYLKIFFAEEPEDQKTLTAHFLSTTVKRVVDHDQLSDGCQAATNINTFFKKELSSKGLALNTTDSRYLNMIGGSFVISHKKNKQIYIGQVSFTDKDKKKLFCQPKNLNFNKES